MSKRTKVVIFIIVAAIVLGLMVWQASRPVVTVNT